LDILTDPECGWTVSVLIGGFIKVLGYFLYQWFLIFPLFEIELVAIAEIPSKHWAKDNRGNSGATIS
jgi:hypothetical protein